MMDKDFELRGEAAERAKPKKLTAADIPEGYNYAAVYSSGNTVAYKTKPVLFAGDFEWVCYTNDSKGIGVFDASDWQNSLVSRETAERQEEQAIKEIENKPSFVELDPDFMEAMAWRMTSNKGKYPANNWKRKHNINDFLDAIQRHLNDIRRQRETGQSQTGESIKAHCAAIACNAMFLHYHTVELNELMRAVYSRRSNAKEI
jgi:hypothetical protein